MALEKRHSKISDNPSEKLIKVEGPRDSKNDELRRSVKADAQPAQKPSITEDVQLIEDVFGRYYDENGKYYDIKRFSWKNKNKIQVQVINFGARITSIKLPDRKGEIEDIVLGFDDFAGYLYHKQHYFGATIGRMSNIVRNSTFEIDRKQYWLTANKGADHFNGGERGLDQAVWKTYVDGKKVIMSHVSPHLSEGYPGDLFVRVSFELSARNEFSVYMDAQTTQPTIVNLTNLTYFNLAGHYAGPDQIYRHVLTINSNCFTPQVNGVPTGEILNVVHTENDFQIPKILGKVMGIVPRDGFNQNFCVNRGMDQGDCFVARVLHPPSGRMLEIYSNQWGVNFSTADVFGYGRVMSMQQLMPEDEVEQPDPVLSLFEKVHKELILHLSVDEKNHYQQIRDLIVKLREKARAAQALNNTPQSGSAGTLQGCADAEGAQSKYLEPIPNGSKSHLNTLMEMAGVVDDEEGEKEGGEEQSCMSEFMLTQLQMDYLENTFKIVCEAVDEDEWVQLKEVMAKILDAAVVFDEPSPENDEVNLSEENVSGSFQIPFQKSSIPMKKKRKTSKQNDVPFFYKSTDKIIGKREGRLQHARRHFAANSKLSRVCQLREFSVLRAAAWRCLHAHDHLQILGEGRQP
ncbi:hypothetical protein NQ318_013050 [Aromia moschata]|uniref:Galactose mutarotase n=1 Tax=Aromia moschata TaxID=1265417 RepID=A0AAV8XMN0_9CUCU|nr:hypothetical protein NQ318_013050 [Aromia moschata]